MDGKIIRPAQDCSNSYGKRIILNKIIELNNKEYIEEKLDILSPKSFGRFKKMHTF